MDTLIQPAGPNAWKRTEYGIRLKSGVWAADHRHWTDRPEHIRRFETMTRATIVATLDLELAPEAYTVEAI